MQSGRTAVPAALNQAVSFRSSQFMNALQRVVRHARITRRNYQNLPSPPFLILFINSICNQKCEHCFYWRNLNRRDDLSKEEIFSLSRSLGRVENLNLSGGEPFLRPEFGEICRQFIRQNQVRQIYVPTNAYFADRTVKQISETLKEPELDLFVAEISLDGLGEFHNKFRGSPGAFDKAMATYDALAQLQDSDPRLRIHAISTATDVNMDEIRRLTTFLFERCPRMDHHNLAMIRGDRKNPSLQPRPGGIPEALRVRAAPVDHARRGPLRLHGGADAAMGQVAHRRPPGAGGAVPRRSVERGGVFQWRRKRVRDARSAGEPAREDVLGNLEFARGAGAAQIHCGAGVLLHERSILVAQHHLPAGGAGAGHARGQSLAGRAPLRGR